jgi:hypothetical protein
VPRGIKVDGDEWFLPVIFGVNANDENEAIAYSVSHNLSALWGSDLTFLDQTRLFDEGLLKDQLVGLADLDMIPVGLDGDDLDLWLGMDGFEQQEEEDSVGDGSGDGAQKGSLQDRFIVPPFSVLDARQGYWQERKRQWLAIGIQSELGRGGGNDLGRLGRDNKCGAELLSRSKANATPGGSLMPSTTYSKDRARGNGKGQAIEQN